MMEASFEDFIKVVLIILLIYFAFRFFIRYFGPMILRYILKRIGKNISKKFYESQNNYQRQREGDVTIEKKPKNRRRKSNNDVGEYVDYEEID